MRNTLAIKEEKGGIFWKKYTPSCCFFCKPAEKQEKMKNIKKFEKKG